jgi:hypothetical protein
MMAVAPFSALALQARGTPSGDVVGSPPDAAPLLPGPTLSALTVQAIVEPSGLASIYALLSQERTSGFALGEQDVATHRQVQAKAYADELSAIHREEDNQRGSGPGFLSCLTRLVGDVARALAGGHVDTAIVDAGGDVEGAWNSPRFWSDLESGLVDVAACAGGVGSIAGLAGGPVGAVVEATAKVVGEGASIGIALATSREEGFSASATAAHADVVWERSAVARLGREISAAIEGERSDDGSLARALQSVAGASLTSDETLVLSTAWKG